MTGICDCCERERDVRTYADEHNSYSACAECEAALREAWEALTTDEREAVLADAQ